MNKNLIKTRFIQIYSTLQRKKINLERFTRESFTKMRFLKSYKSVEKEQRIRHKPVNNFNGETNI